MNVAPDFEMHELVAQAAAWRLASLLLERPRPEWKSEVAQLCSEVTDGTLSSCAKEADQGTEELYHRLFGPGGMVSPREVSYCGFEDPGRLMAELSAFYQAFSYQPRQLIQCYGQFTLTVPAIQIIFSPAWTLFCFHLWPPLCAKVSSSCTL